MELKNYIYMCSYKVYQREGGATWTLQLAQKAVELGGSGLCTASELKFGICSGLWKVLK